MTAAQLDAVTLDRGNHTTPDDGMCLLEAVAWFAGEKFSDAPQCVSPVLRTFGINLNDQWDETQRQKLKPFIPRMIGTASDGQDAARSYLALDWLIRTFTPAWLDLAGLTVEAAELRALRRIADMTAAEAAGPVVRQAHNRAAAAWAAAGAAAGAAAWAAARAAAGDAAWAAARAAAGAAAWAAAGAAAGDAAGAAARAALKPTVELLQASALDLFDAMINPAGAA